MDVNQSLRLSDVTTTDTTMIDINCRLRQQDDKLDSKHFNFLCLATRTNRTASASTDSFKMGTLTAASYHEEL